MFPPDFRNQRKCYNLFPMNTDTPNKPAHDSHLLVVDDDVGIRELLSRYLSEQGFHVSTVEDGEAMDA